MAYFTDADSSGQASSTEVCEVVAVESPYAQRDAYGIGIASTRSEVQAAYGSPASVSGNSEFYPGAGITFMYNASGAVMAIRVYAPAS